MKRAILIIFIIYNLFPLNAIPSLLHTVDYITIINPRPTKSIFPPVDFSHKKHYVDYKIPCLNCHHAWNSEKSAYPRKCIYCHKTDRNKANKEFILLRNAFHRSCKDCHANISTQKKPTGPIKCDECHIKNKMINNKDPRAIYTKNMNTKKGPEQQGLF
ncbi:MAG: cytochrome c3 family protein [bacterium]